VSDGVLGSGRLPNVVRVACCQIRPVMGDVEGNRDLVRRAVRAAVDAGARLIVLPELCTTGYVFESAEEARALGQSADGGALADWSEEAARGDAVVVGGFAETAGSAIYNSAAVVDKTGVLAVYRKTHLWNTELQIFDKGAVPAPVVQTSVGAIGVSICYDLFFPELLRGLALQGADIVVAPTNSPAGQASAAADTNIGISIARASAHVNRIYIAVCDRWGAERGTDWVGRSVIVDPGGTILANPPGDMESLVVADCDLSAAQDKRWAGTPNHAMDDLRPELYRPIS
jgi:predicted amidohydrolase